MQMINMLFLIIAEMSLTAGIVIVVVLFVRLLIRRLPKNYAYILWAVVAFRLIVPISADSGISIFNLFDLGKIYSELSGNEGIGKKYAADSFGTAFGNAVKRTDEWVDQENWPDSARNMETDTENALSAGADKKNTAVSYFNNSSDSESTSGNGESDIRYAFQTEMRNNRYISVMATVWAVGILSLAAYSVTVYIRIRRRVRYSIRLYGNVYECDRIRSPFVLGICSPRIYLPFRLTEVEQQCILAHERYHIRRRDYVIKSFAYVLAIVYWFQPLVWIAYRLMCIDMEMSCDEKIIGGFTADMRKEYSRLLLAFAANKRQLPANPLAFGEENTMKRIKNIMNYKRTAGWRLAGGVAVLILTMAACGTNASTDEAIAPVPDKSFERKDSSVNDDAGNAADSDVVVNTINGIDVTVHHSEKNDTNRHHQKEQIHHTMEHHQAQWAENSMCDWELCSLDYADSDKIVFHISSGLFQYDLQEQRIVRSIDLKALNCQEVQTGGECRITVYHDSENHLRAVIAPYPYSDEDSYVYDLEEDELFAYDGALLERYTLFDGLISKYDLPEEERLKGWEHAEHILPLEDHSYGVLRWESVELGTMYYEVGDQKWELFHKEQATLPKLLKQDDSFYQSLAMVSGRSIHQCLLDYEAFYNRHDYAGVCALSTGLEYSDEMQKEFGERLDLLSLADEVSHSEDEKEYLFQFSCGDDYGVDGPKVYVSFQYLEGEGWRAAGLPTEQNSEME